jgi:methylated-DNA-protein-cysteine methyltransferase related protein
MKPPKISQPVTRLVQSPNGAQAAQDTYLDRRQRVFEVIKRIPRGKVATYGQIARLAQIPNPRQVGSILHTNTNPADYPCHRVIKSDGSVAGGYAFGERDGQIKRLEAEEVFFHGQKKLDLATYQWQPE